MVTNGLMILEASSTMILGTNVPNASLNINPNPNRQGFLIYRGCLNLPVN